MGYPLARHSGHGQHIYTTRWKHGIASPTDTHDPQGRHRNCQPQSCGPIWVRHFCLVPVPAATFAILKALFDPCPHAIPCNRRCLWCQVGQHQPWRTLLGVPVCKQRAVEPTLAWATATRRSSSAGISGCLARRRCATWNTYGEAPRNVWVKERFKSRASIALVCMRVGACWTWGTAQPNEATREDGGCAENQERTLLFRMPNFLFRGLVFCSGNASVCRSL